MARLRLYGSQPTVPLGRRSRAILLRHQHAAARLPLIDLARGAALMAMFAYHLVWDLAYFGWIEAAAPLDPRFKLFGHAIAASFLFLAGFSIVLAQQRGASPGRLLRHVAVIALGAAAITAVTAIVIPRELIFFGILHCIAASSFLALALRRAPPWVVAIAALAAFAAPLAAVPVFNAPQLVWLGLETIEPRSNDYRPLLPWLGFVLTGLVAGRLFASRLKTAASPTLLTPIAFGGRHSLAAYLIHQPVFFAVFMLLAAFAPPQISEAAFNGECRSACAGAGGEPAVCQATCDCVLRSLKRADLLRAGALDPQAVSRVQAASRACQADPAIE